MPPPGFTTNQGRNGPNRPEWSNGRLGAPHEGFAGTRAEADKVCPLTTGGNAPRILRWAAWGVAWIRHGEAVRHVGEQAGVTARTASASVEDGTLLHNLAQQGTACSGVPPTVAGRMKTVPASAGVDYRIAHQTLVRRPVAA